MQAKVDVKVRAQPDMVACEITCGNHVVLVEFGEDEVRFSRHEAGNRLFPQSFPPITSGAGKEFPNTPAGGW